MARRRGRKQTYEVRRSEAYDVPLLPEAVRPSRVSAIEESDELLGYSLPTSDTVYPWYPSKPLRVYTPSPYRHERSEFRSSVYGPVWRLYASLREHAVGFCKQRFQRRQVLFAHGVAGGRVRGFRRRRYSSKSSYRC